MTKHVGILTAGGDTPGLNAAIRGVGKAVQDVHGMQILGFRDGFRGLMDNRTMRLDGSVLSGILTIGGTILGTSRDKPHKMPVGGKILDMTDAMVDVYSKHQLDVLVCLGGGGTMKNAYRLAKKGLKIITLPKTIDADVPETDVTFGFDTALGIATEAIDRLHSTAHSHHRIIVVEIMGHNAGWLPLASGIAGGADVILIPEIPYEVEKIAGAIRRRQRTGKHFSIVALSEGAMSTADRKIFDSAILKVDEGKPKEKEEGQAELARFEADRRDHPLRLSKQLEAATGLEARVTILGHVQRGGAPSSADRLLATHLGTAAADLIQEGKHGVMVALKGGKATPVPLEKVISKRKTVPLDHPWITAARHVGTNLGD